MALTKYYNTATGAWETLPVVGGGDSGGAGAPSGYEFIQATPASSWTIPLPGDISRRVSVSVWVSGEEVETDISQDATNVYISFPSPVAGSAILN